MKFIMIAILGIDLFLFGILCGIILKSAFTKKRQMHGYWKYEDVDIICSVCHGDGVMPWNKSTQHKFPYCPHCGAKMDG